MQSQILNMRVKKTLYIWLNMLIEIINCIIKYEIDQWFVFENIRIGARYPGVLVWSFLFSQMVFGHKHY